MKIRHLQYQFVGVFFFAPDLSQVSDKIGCSHNSFSSFQVTGCLFISVQAVEGSNITEHAMLWHVLKFNPLKEIVRLFVTTIFLSREEQDQL
jgi:hypothetical protein